MSRFFRPELTLAMAGGQALLQEKAPFKKVRRQEKTLPAVAFEERLRDALTLLPLTAPARLHLFLPSSQFLFWNVPWVSAQLSEIECVELASNLLRQDFDLSAQDLAFTLSPAAFGQSRLACGLSRSKLDALRPLLPVGITLAGVRPLLSLSWAHLQATREPLLYTEPGFAALLARAEDGLRMHCRRLPQDRFADDDTAHSLAELLGIQAPRKFRLHLNAAQTEAPGFDALDLTLLMRAT